MRYLFPLALISALSLVTVGCGDDATPGDCSAATCNGCCDNGQCQVGNLDTACGLGGGACAACQTGESCQTGVCKTGGSCDNGCLDGQQVCQPGNANDACGTSGAACTSCQSGTTCSGGKCETACNVTTCPNGCCAADGTCVDPVTDTQCGGAGAACQACTGTDKCESGVCADTTKDCTNCPGCCANGTTCLPGDTAAACGTAGAACSTCTTTEKCTAGACLTNTGTCDAASCPSGCCLPDKTCVPFAGQGTASCGKAGEACNVCKTGELCQQGTCVANQPCFSFCKQGCCTASGQCIAFAGQDAKKCGTGGITCSACGTDLSCAQGTCVTDATWEVSVTSAVIAPKNAAGKDWDSSFFSNPLPDAYLGAKLGGALLMLDFTKVIDDTLTPAWNEVLATWTQSDLLNKGLDITVRDSDGLLGYPFETISDCTVALTQGDLTAGTKTIAACGTSVTQIVLTFTLKK